MEVTHALVNTQGVRLATGCRGFSALVAGTREGTENGILEGES